MTRAKRSSRLILFGETEEEEEEGKRICSRPAEMPIRISLDRWDKEVAEKNVKDSRRLILQVILPLEFPELLAADKVRVDSCGR